MRGRRIAAFDFDGTLTRRDTLLPFLVRACGRLAVSRSVARVAPVAARARISRVQEAIHHRDATKAALLRDLLAGRSADWLAREGNAYAASLAGRLRPDMVEQVAWHRNEGHELIIVSAGLLAYLAPFAAEHGFDDVIAVDLAVDDQGMLTGDLVSPNVRGPEKAVRMGAWLDGDEPELMWAYGNSSGDRELLAMADAPVWVADPDADR